MTTLIGIGVAGAAIGACLLIGVAYIIWKYINFY